MADSKIFFLEDNADSLAALVEAPYDTEDILQALLARYHDLLPGDQIDPESPRRWLFVSREMGVPGEAGGGDQWSLDHLFLDQDAIPTFVECKRSSDTRGRREVVAQMLDYAANGVEYWSMDRLRQAAAETARQQGQALDQVLLKLLNTDDEAAIESYWQQVEANLRAGRVRLIFVADETPRELRRLVEFLNEKMADVEVLAVEVKQYVGKGGKAFVPRVIGLTEAVRSSKGAGTVAKRVTSRAEFLAKCSPQGVAFFTHLLDRAEEKKLVIGWGQVGFSVRIKNPGDDKLISFAYCYPDGRFEFFTGYLPLPGDEKTALRQWLRSFGVFKESGEFTLRALVDGTHSVPLTKVCDDVFDKMESVFKPDAGSETNGPLAVATTGPDEVRESV